MPKPDTLHKNILRKNTLTKIHAELNRSKNLKAVGHSFQKTSGGPETPTE